MCFVLDQWTRIDGMFFLALSTKALRMTVSGEAKVSTSHAEGAWTFVVTVSCTSGIPCVILFEGI